MATNDKTKERAEDKAQEVAAARPASPKHGPEAEGEHPAGYVEAADVNAHPSTAIEPAQGQEPDAADAPPVGLPQTVAQMEQQRITREAAERETAQREVLESGDVERAR